MLKDSLDTLDFNKGIEISNRVEPSKLLTGKIDKYLVRMMKRLGVLRYLYTYLAESSSNNVSKLITDSSKVGISKNCILETYHSLIELNNGNSSSFACSDLMEKYSLDIPLDLVSSSLLRKAKLISRSNELDEIILKSSSLLALKLADIEKNYIKESISSPVRSYRFVPKDFILTENKPKVNSFKQGIIPTLSKIMLKEFRSSFEMFGKAGSSLNILLL